MTPEELEQGYWRLYDEVFRLGAIFRRVFGGPARRSLFAQLFLLGVNLHYRGFVRRRICPGMV